VAKTPKKPKKLTKKQQEQRFLDHLQGLALVYAPDMSDLPTADQVISGLRMPTREMTFDEQFQLTTEIVSLMEERLPQYQSFAILGETVMARWLEFADNHLPVELAIVFTKRLLGEGDDGFQFAVTPEIKVTLEKWGL